MAFLVEDGTGLALSNSYGSVADADTYFLDRAIAAWAALDDPAKQAALIAATDYIDARFGHLFQGAKVDADVQALEFPRDAFVDADDVPIIPTKLKQATFEYALRASASPLAPDPTVDPSGYQVSEYYEKAGPLEEKTSFATIGSGSNRQLLKPYPAADMLLRNFLRSTGSRVIRN
jgi:hypothetical protein